MKYRYRFSFVMPVYNVEKYLVETVESILAQTLNFEQNCEIIFVNDGSPDDSEQICLEYQERFPENIKYIKQPNTGVSAARNRGLEEVEGKYVSFLDSDDKLSPDTLEEVLAFFESHYNKIDVVSIKVVMFEAREGEHTLSYKFATTRIVDISDNYKDIQFSAASSFVKTAMLHKGYRFDPRLKRFAEDLKFMTILIMKKKQYGILAGPIYYYRKRSDNQSSTDLEVKSKEWYLGTPRLVHYDLINQFKDKSGHLPRYIQFTILTDLQRRFRAESLSVLTKKEQQEYKEIIRGILQYIEDDLIINQQRLRAERMFFMLGLKYGKSLLNELQRNKGEIYYGKRQVYDYGKSGRQTVYIRSISFVKGGVVLEGRMSGVLLGGLKLVIKVAGQYYSAHFFQKKGEEVYSLGELVSYENSFRVTVPSRDKAVITYHITATDYEKRIPQILETSTGLSGGKQNSYKIGQGTIVIAGTNELRLQSNTPYHRAVRLYKSIKNIRKEVGA